MRLTAIFVALNFLGCQAVQASPPTKPLRLLSDEDFLFKLSTPAEPALATYFEPNPGEVNVPHIRFEVEIDEKSAEALMGLIDRAAATRPAALIIEINSPGGDTDAGFQIQKKLESLTFPTHCVVDGQAASMALYMMSSCTVRHMTRRSRLMAHEAAFGGGGGRLDEVTLFNLQTQIDAVTFGLVVQLAGRMGVPVTDVLKRIRGGREWWLTVDEAVGVKMVDHQCQSVKDVVSALRLPVSTTEAR